MHGAEQRGKRGAVCPPHTHHDTAAEMDDWFPPYSAAVCTTKVSTPETSLTFPREAQKSLEGRYSMPCGRNTIVKVEAARLDLCFTWSIHCFHTGSGWSSLANPECRVW
eukprot:m.89002 g.89002  ORF g.89002 m.89002 type:complete len:109 (-) comp11693_c0_seq1:11-337(-)